MARIAAPRSYALGPFRRPPCRSSRGQRAPGIGSRPEPLRLNRFSGNRRCAGERDSYLNQNRSRNDAGNEQRAKHSHNCEEDVFLCPVASRERRVGLPIGPLVDRRRLLQHSLVSGTWNSAASQNGPSPVQAARPAENLWHSPSPSPSGSE